MAARTRLFSPIEPGRLHEVLGEDNTGGFAVTLGWLTKDSTDAACHVWIGKTAWPASTTLHRSGLLETSLLIDARSAAERAWAAELCVRCSSVAAVVADGRGFDLTMTRRLQLAARGTSCRLIVLRPAGEGGSSAAGSRWRVSPVSAVGDLPRRPRWSVELLKHKGGYFAKDGQGADDDRPVGLRTAGEMFTDESDATAIVGGPARDRRWTFEWDPAAGRGVPVDLPSDVADRPAKTPMAWTG
ncbi:MAG: hypothetical protein AAF656_00100 [Planctomycetota bacterium]